MAERVEMIFKSRDMNTQIHAVTWLPEERPPKAILQIVHGMKEYIGRYDAFARYVADRGFIVVGEDHLGHGETALSKKDLGFFADKDAETILVKDVHRLKKIIQEEYPGLPYFFYGFSMGSFITRKYLTMYGEGIDGAIIAGTGYKDEAILNTGIAITDTLSKLKSPHFRSKFVEDMAFKGYNSRISPSRSAYDWLCTDDSVVTSYERDSLCNYSFTVNGYNTLFKLIKYVQKPENARRVPAKLPVLFTSGMEDPVGGYGKGVMKAASLYMANGMNNVSLKMYEGMRHEIHNEKRKHIVYLDILEWLESLL